MNDFIESSSVYIAVTIVFVRILFSKCLFYFTFLTLLICFWFLSPEPDASNFSWSFFFLNEAESFMGIDIEMWRSKNIKMPTLILHFDHCRFQQDSLPFLQLCTSVLRNYLWSQEYIITLAYCYVLVYIRLLGLYTVL